MKPWLNPPQSRASRSARVTRLTSSDRYLRAVAGAVLCLCTLPLQAMTFAQAYEAARTYDANYRAAGHERDATHLGVPIARAALLPSVSLSASETYVRGTRQVGNGSEQEVSTRLDYQAPQASLSLRLPILNYEALSNYRQAQVQFSAADEQYRGQGMDLMERLAAAYLQVMLGNDAFELAQTQVNALQAQLAQATQREAKGEGTRVQVVQFQANVDVASARLLEAADLRELHVRELARLTGVRGVLLAPLPAAQAPTPLFPQQLGDWLEAAVRQSPLLRLREHLAEVARLGVERQFAGHLPRLEVVSSISRNRNDSVSNLGQATQLRSVGLQLTVPLFSGGAVDASVRQASARKAQAEEDLRSEREALEVDVQRHYKAIQNGGAKIVALQRAVDSTALALQGARRALELGQGTASEVAELQAQHFGARRDLAQARVEQLLSRVRLMVRAGTPMDDVAADLDASLVAPKAVAVSSLPFEHPLGVAASPLVEVGPDGPLSEAEATEY